MFDVGHLFRGDAQFGRTPPSSRPSSPVSEASEAEQRVDKAASSAIGAAAGARPSLPPELEQILDGVIQDFPSGNSNQKAPIPMTSDAPRPPAPAAAPINQVPSPASVPKSPSEPRQPFSQEEFLRVLDAGADQFPAPPPALRAYIRIGTQLFQAEASGCSKDLTPADLKTHIENLIRDNPEIASNFEQIFSSQNPPTSITLTTTGITSQDAQGVSTPLSLPKLEKSFLNFVTTCVQFKRAEIKPSPTPPASQAAAATPPSIGVAAAPTPRLPAAPAAARRPTTPPVEDPGDATAFLTSPPRNPAPAGRRRWSDCGNI